MKIVRFVYITLLITITCSSVHAEAPYQVAWTQQLGTSAYEYSRSVAVDSNGNAYISGGTGGSLGGTNAGSWDAFLAKYNSAGILQWTQQLGTSDRDESYSVAIDSTGNAFISGFSYGSLGGANAGLSDAFLAKYDSAGTLQWTQQLGTSSDDTSFSVAVDSTGNAFISGYTEGSLDGVNGGSYDAFLTKYNSAGTLQWTQQLGTSAHDQSYSVAVDSTGNAFISGRTWGNLGGSNTGGWDAFLAKYNSDGTLQWTQQLGASDDDTSFSVAVDSTGNAYISGRTWGNLGGANAGGYDAFLAKYDTAGILQWTQQLGTSNWDQIHSVAVDTNGNAFISGYTGGNLGGAKAGGWDAFLVKYDSDGDFLWTQQLGTSSHDESYSVAVDSNGNAYISGYTSGNLGGANAGGWDAFLVKFEAPVPEPGMLSLLCIGGLALLRRGRTRKWVNG